MCVLLGDIPLDGKSEVGTVPAYWYCHVDESEKLSVSDTYIPYSRPRILNFVGGIERYEHNRVSSLHSTPTQKM
jgi:hypothetical protein